MRVMLLQIEQAGKAKAQRNFAHGLNSIEVTNYAQRLKVKVDNGSLIITKVVKVTLSNRWIRDNAFNTELCEH